MRFVPVLIIIIIMAFLPSILYSRHVLKKKPGVTKRIVVAYAIPTLVILAFILIQDASRAMLIDFRILEWTLWGFLLYLLPINAYTACYIIDKIIYKFTKKSNKALHYIGASLALIIIFGLMIGMITRHNIQIRKVVIESEFLPKEFNGIRIAHITDLHLGNLSPRDNYLKKIIKKLNEQQVDILVFTGDMMNLTANEAKGSEGLFAEVSAPLGRYAVMGNHDYGDYISWNSVDEYETNLMATYKAYHKLGFTLLNDSALYITKNNDSIGIIGIENWGRPPFPRYGDLAEATTEFQPAKFNILLSHDPNHWLYEVSTDEQYHYINLTLSGHTHSAQIGLDLGRLGKWSPSQWIFETWDGLYEKDGQYLFISRGLGYVGIPFRLGMPAEITIIELCTNTNKND